MNLNFTLNYTYCNQRDYDTLGRVILDFLDKAPFCSSLLDTDIHPSTKRIPAEILINYSF